MTGEGAGAPRIAAEAGAARTVEGVETEIWSAEQTCNVVAHGAGVFVVTVQTVAGRVVVGLAGQIFRLGVDAGRPTAVVAGGLLAGSVAWEGEGLGAEVAAATENLYLLLRATNNLLCSPKR